MSYKSFSKQKIGGVKTIKSPKATCVFEAKTCINYDIKCRDCVRIQGKYTEYKELVH